MAYVAAFLGKSHFGNRRKIFKKIFFLANMNLLQVNLFNNSEPIYQKVGHDIQAKVDRNLSLIFTNIAHQVSEINCFEFQVVIISVFCFRH